MRAAAALAIAAALAVAAGCDPIEPTQAIIEITTDLDCSTLQGVYIELIGGDDTRRTVTSTDQCSPGRIGSLVFLPDGAGSGNFTVIVVAAVDVPPTECEANGFMGCIVARRNLTFGKEPVEIHLTDDCVGIACSTTTTCVTGGTCEVFTVDRSSCEEVCDESSLGAPMAEGS
jgi:hypothetical protein